MKTIHLDELIIPENRHRELFNAEAIEELADSIVSLGLLHPPVVRSDGRTLVAGERRIRAMRMLYERGHTISFAGEGVSEGHIPITTMGELSDIEVKEAELEENLRREDLTWQEREKAIAELHELRTEQKGTQTYRATAQELLGPDAPASAGTRVVRNATIIAQHLDDPEVAKAKNPQEAMKIIERKAVNDLRRAYSELDAMEREYEYEEGEDSETPSRRRSPHECLFGSFEEQIDQTQVTFFDVVITDPPYGIDAQGFGSQANTPHEYDDSETSWEEMITQLATHLYASTQDSAHIYVFCDPKRFDHLVRTFEIEGFDVWPTPLIWDKGNGMLPRPEHGPRRTYEMILFASKGNKPVNFVANDVIRIPADRDKQHAAQKPVELYVELLRRSALPGDHVLDCFAGSGPIFPAAEATNTYATGIEKSPEYYAIAKQRMEDLL